MSLDGDEDFLLHLKEHQLLTAEEKLRRDRQFIDDSVTFLLLAFFSFFFIVVGVILFTHWREKRKVSGRFIVLPHITLPGYMTVVLTRTPTHRVLAHYQLDDSSLCGTRLVTGVDKKNCGSVERKNEEDNGDNTNCVTCHPFSEGKQFPEQ
ncbi:uncharacterized protein LOC143037465 isoform X2 [Oratosquilla oratoria]